MTQALSKTLETKRHTSLLHPESCRTPISFFPFIGLPIHYPIVPSSYPRLEIISRLSTTHLEHLTAVFALFHTPVSQAPLSQDSKETGKGKGYKGGTCLIARLPAQHMAYVLCTRFLATFLAVGLSVLHSVSYVYFLFSFFSTPVCLAAGRWSCACV